MLRFLVDFALRIARGILPRPVKRYLKRFWDPRQSLTLREAALLARSTRSWPFGRKTLRSFRSEGPGFYPSKFDVVWLGIFEWQFRRQRPQHFAAELGRRGYRVFYVCFADDLSGSSPSYRVEPVSANVWQVRVVTNSLDLYRGGWKPEDLGQISETLAKLRADWHLSTAVLVVQYPGWTQIAAAAHNRFGWLLVYDCLDDWEHLPGSTSEIIQSERQLVRIADLQIVSSERLRKKWGAQRTVVLLRNAADFEFFSSGRSPGLRSETAVAGYFGALADWFDFQLLEQVAAALPSTTFILIGSQTAEVPEGLRVLKNVKLLGEKPYQLMPGYLAQFNIGLIPFRRNELTDSTDPVKLYEYFSQGKPVVATGLAELFQYQDLIYLASDADEFTAKTIEALRESDPEKAARRIELARSNTWALRVEALLAAVTTAHPRLSVVIVTFENVEYTMACLESLFRNTLYPNLEVIVVDNASGDGTLSYLESLGERIRLIANPMNLGFAAAMNRGLDAACGDLLVLLNNDVVLPNGWATKLIRHLRDPKVGLAVSVTNFSGNESRIDVTYRSLEKMEDFARQYTTAHDGEIFDIGVAAMYCLGMRRDVYEKVGPLDESFTIGLFEDDDYSNRVRQAGYRVVCAEDSFVHHFGQASFRKLSTQDYESLWKRNQEIYERKWSKWTPHTSRQPRS